MPHPTIPERNVGAHGNDDHLDYKDQARPYQEVVSGVVSPSSLPRPLLTAFGATGNDLPSNLEYKDLGRTYAGN